MADKLPAGVIDFHALSSEEYNRSVHSGMRPRHERFECGMCGVSTQGRTVCSMFRNDGREVLWCLCSCEKQEPTVLVMENGKVQLCMSRIWPNLPVCF